MKLRTEIITLCDYASISKDGKLSIDGIFDEVRVQKFPGGLARAFLVAVIHGKPDTSYSLRFNLEYGIEAKSTNKLDARTGANGKANIVTELLGLGFEKAGDYNFTIYHEKEKVGSVTMKVMHANESQTVTYKLPN